MFLLIYLGEGRGYTNACMYGNTQSAFTIEPLDECLRNLKLIKRIWMKITEKNKKEEKLSNALPVSIKCG